MARRSQSQADSEAESGDDTMRKPRRAATRAPDAPAPEADGEADGDEAAPDQPMDQESEGNATQAGRPITVQIIAGPDKGKKRPVRGGRMIVGRGEGCDLQLSDASMSRRHAELIATSDEVVVRDLGSGNGTVVNGKKIAAEQVLKHGDEVCLGDTVLKIVDELQAIEEARAEQAKAKERAEQSAREKAEAEAAAKAKAEAEAAEKAAAGGGAAAGPAPSGPARTVLFVALALTLAGGVWYGVYRLVPNPTDTQTYANLVEQGTKHMSLGQYREASEKLKAAQKMGDKPELARLVATCEKEAAAAERLAEAKQAAASGSIADLDRARALIEAVPEDARAYDEARMLYRKWGDALDRQSVQQVKAALAAGDLALAARLLQKVPESQVPPLAKALAEAEEKAKRDAEQRRQANVLDEEQRRIEAAKQAWEEAQRQLEPALRKIEAANFDGAVRELDRLIANPPSKPVGEKAVKLRKVVPAFGLAYREGMTRYESGAYEASSGPLTRALALYKQMDVETSLGEPLKETAARALVFKGQAAIARQEYGAAARAFRQSIELSPKSAAMARSGLQELAAKAQEVFAEGIVARNRSVELARRRFSDVMDMVPPTHELYRDSQKQLRELEQRDPSGGPF